jgi:hypothetical protein
MQLTANGGVDRDAMGVHRSGDVLDLLLAHVLECEGEIVSHLVAHDPAKADAPRPRQGFKPNGDVYAIAEDVVPIDDDVAKIDADAEFDARFGRHTMCPIRSMIRPQRNAAIVKPAK